MRGIALRLRRSLIVLLTLWVFVFLGSQESRIEEGSRGPALLPAPSAEGSNRRVTPPRRRAQVALGRHCNALAEVARNDVVGPERGLLLLGAGHRNSDLVDALVLHFLGAGNFVVVLLAYEDFDWKGSFPSWAKDVEIIRESGWKYLLAEKHFPADKLERMGVSHIFMWDDDVELTPQFNASLFLRVLQSAPQIQVAAPAVGANCHLACWTAKPPADLLTVHAVASTPEMMFPIYSTTAWSCYATLLNKQTPEMWGIDSSAAGCACRDVGAALVDFGQAIFVNQLVHHADRKGNQGKFNYTRARLAEEHIHGELRKRRPGDWKECLERSTEVRTAAEGPGPDAPTVCFG